MALCTFALLWRTRLSAKLNLFFGVPFVGENNILPVHLRYSSVAISNKPLSHCVFPDDGRIVVHLGMDGVGGTKRYGFGQCSMGIAVFITGISHH
jgi:hypothetical protein